MMHARGYKGYSNHPPRTLSTIIKGAPKIEILAGQLVYLLRIVEEFTFYFLLNNIMKFIFTSYFSENK